MCPKKFALALDGLQEALALECQYGSRKVVRLTFNGVYKIIQNTENSYIVNPTILKYETIYVIQVFVYNWTIKT